jgi:hypothetical protein
MLEIFQLLPRGIGPVNMGSDGRSEIGGTLGVTGTFTVRIHSA